MKEDSGLIDMNDWFVGEQPVRMGLMSEGRLLLRRLLYFTYGRDPKNPSGKCAANGNGTTEERSSYPCTWADAGVLKEQGLLKIDS